MERMLIDDDDAIFARCDQISIVHLHRQGRGGWHWINARPHRGRFRRGQIIRGVGQRGDRIHGHREPLKANSSLGLLMAGKIYAEQVVHMKFSGY